MASLVHRDDRGRAGWLLSFYTADKRSRSLWLGDISKRNANNVKRHVEELVRSQKANSRPEADSELWASEVTGRIRAALVKCGLAKPEAKRLDDDASLYLGPYLDHYIAQRFDLKPRTRNNLQQAQAWAVKFFGERKLLTSITQADFEQWIRWMSKERESEPAAKAKSTAAGKGKQGEKKGRSGKETLSLATACRHAKRLRQMLAFGVRSKLLSVNPGDGVKLGSEVNASRQFFISREVAREVLEHCPCIEWKLIFALSRFAGLRCPTEVLGLTWSDIDWSRQRIRIDSVKTGLRFCPMFPELKPLLEQAFDEAPEGAIYVISQFRDRTMNLRSRMNSIIRSAGVEPWSKTFVNLRSTCRTELEEIHPSHAIDYWLGHSSEIARKHYLQITDEHWDKATRSPGASDPIGAGAGAGISASGEPSGVVKENGRPNKRQVETTADDSSKQPQYPRLDSNQRLSV